MDRNMRIGGPCELCGLPQIARAQGCTRSNAECAYGKDPDPEIMAMVTQAAPQPKPMRLARMLKLYVAAHEELTQKRVAQEAGISESSLSRFLSGEQMLDGRAFAALVAWCFGDHKA